MNKASRSQNGSSLPSPLAWKNAFTAGVVSSSMARRSVCMLACRPAVMRFDMAGGLCGMWSLSPRISCSVCLPGVRLTSASDWPAPKCRCLKFC
jgi:hypothetical protein